MFFGLFSFSVFLSSVFHVVFCLFFLISFATWSLQKCLLHLFMSSFRSSSFHLLSLFSLLVSRFFRLFLTFLNFLFWSNSLCKKIFLDFCKTLFFYLLFSVKISVFSVSFFFVVPFSHQFIFSMFCFSVS